MGKRSQVHDWESEQTGMGIREKVGPRHMRKEGRKLCKAMHQRM
jgi:hypothetical protein